MKKLALVVMIGLSSMYSLAHALTLEEEISLSPLCDKAGEMASKFREKRIIGHSIGLTMKNSGIEVGNPFYPTLKRVYSMPLMAKESDARVIGWLMCMDHFSK